jgi:hypothetical protein
MAGSSFSDGAQAVISAMLQSPYFLYRTEIGTQSGGTFNLTSFEVATAVASLPADGPHCPPTRWLSGGGHSVSAGGLTLTAMIDQQATPAAREHDRPPGTRRTLKGFTDGMAGARPACISTAHDDTVCSMSKTIRDED